MIASLGNLGYCYDVTNCLKTDEFLFPKFMSTYLPLKKNIFVWIPITSNDVIEKTNECKQLSERWFNSNF